MFKVIFPQRCPLLSGIPIALLLLFVHTPLLAAADKKQSKHRACLLRAPLPVPTQSMAIDQLEYSGKALLHHAACEGDLALVRKLLTWGASIDLEDFHGHTAFQYAIDHYQPKVLRFLISQGANISVRWEMKYKGKHYRTGGNVLHCLAARSYLGLSSEKKVELLQLLIVEAKAREKEQQLKQLLREYYWKVTPIQRAIKDRSFEIVFRLMASGLIEDDRDFAHINASKLLTGAHYRSHRLLALSTLQTLSKVAEERFNYLNLLLGDHLLEPMVYIIYAYAHPALQIPIIRVREIRHLYKEDPLKAKCIKRYMMYTGQQAIWDKVNREESAMP